MLKCLGLMFLIKVLSGKEMNEDVVNYMMSKANWTTCDKFLSKTNFYPESVIDVDWKVFYFWDVISKNSYDFRFSKPTPLLIDRMHVTVGPEVSQKVNWSAAELFMETSTDWSSILIRTERRGVYQCVTCSHLAYMTFPIFEIALKLVDGYLGIMNCKLQFAYAMAPIDNMPSALEVEKASARIGFWNPIGRSYAVKSNNTLEVPLRQVEDLDDMPDNEEMEIKIDRAEYETL